MITCLKNAALQAVVEHSTAWHEIQELGLHMDKLADGLTTLPVGSSAANCHRLIKYAADPVNTDQFNERVVAFEAHTDDSWFTIIPCTKVPGLEIESPSGEGWFSSQVPTSSHSFATRIPLA